MIFSFAEFAAAFKKAVYSTYYFLRCSYFQSLMNTVATPTFDNSH